MNNEEKNEKMELPTRRAERKVIGLKVVAALLAGSILLNGILYLRYQSQSNENKKLNQALASQSVENKKLLEHSKRLSEVNDAQNEKDMSETTATDSSFVALSPDGGFLASNNLTVFEFTPHKNATKYLVEIRFIGQNEYSPAQPADQSIDFRAGETQPDRIKITKTLPDGDYQWRVSAITIVDGVETVLQSTEDRNYQIR